MRSETLGALRGFVLLRAVAACWLATTLALACDAELEERADTGGDGVDTATADGALEGDGQARDTGHDANDDTALVDTGAGRDVDDTTDDAALDAANDGDTGPADVSDTSAPDQLEPPGQLLVYDGTLTHDVDTMAFTFFPYAEGLPDNLVSPADYAHGTYHARLVVVSKPSDLEVAYQSCFFQDQHTSDNHACTSYQRFTATGTYETEQPMEQIYQHAVVEWDRALLDFMLVVKDTDGKPVDTRYGFDGAWAGAPDLGLYYPMQVRYTAVLVPPGGTFTGFPP